MLARASLRKQMDDPVPPTGQPIRAMQAVAPVGIGFRAHDAYALRARRKTLGRRAESRGLHVLHVRHLSVSAERLALPVVGNTGLRQRLA